MRFVRISTETHESINTDLLIRNSKRIKANCVLDVAFQLPIVVYGHTCYREKLIFKLAYLRIRYILYMLARIISYTYMYWQGIRKFKIIFTRITRPKLTSLYRQYTVKVEATKLIFKCNIAHHMYAFN